MVCMPCPSITSVCFSLVCGYLVFPQMIWKKGKSCNSVSILFCVGPCRDNSWLCIGSSDGLYVVELATSELLTAFYFKGRLLVVKIATVLCNLFKH